MRHIKYPYDPTGVNERNLVVNEIHDTTSLMENPHRSVVLDQGSFYTDSLVVRDQGANVLTKDIDYVTTWVNPEATAKTGIEVSGVLVIINPTVSAVVYVDYQAVGGEEGDNIYMLDGLLEATQNDNRSIQWGNLLDRPSTYQPSGHLHALFDIYGFQPLADTLTGMINHELQESRDAIQPYWTTVNNHYDQLEANTVVFQTAADHIANNLNPHQTTKTHLSLNLLENYPVATEPEVDGAMGNQYLTPLRTKQLIENWAKSYLDDHTNDLYNPHGTTPATLNAYDAGQVDALMAGKVDVASETLTDVTVAKTEKLDNKSYTQAYNALRLEWHADDLESVGTLHPDRLGVGPDTDAILIGDQTWKPVQEIEDEFSAYSSGVFFEGDLGPMTQSQALVHIQNEYGDNWAPGTTVFYTRDIEYRYDGQSTKIVTVKTTFAAVRHNGNWVTASPGGLVN